METMVKASGLDLQDVQYDLLGTIISIAAKKSHTLDKSSLA